MFVKLDVNKELRGMSVQENNVSACFLLKAKDIKNRSHRTHFRFHYAAFPLLLCKPDTGV